MNKFLLLAASAALIYYAPKTGNVGTNVGLTTKFQAESVIGTVHANPDIFTAQCAADLSVACTHI